MQPIAESLFPPSQQGVQVRPKTRVTSSPVSETVLPQTDLSVLKVPALRVIKDDVPPTSLEQPSRYGKMRNEKMSRKGKGLGVVRQSVDLAVGSNNTAVVESSLSEPLRITLPYSFAGIIQDGALFKGKIWNLELNASGSNNSIYITPRDSSLSYAGWTGQTVVSGTAIYSSTVVNKAIVVRVPSLSGTATVNTAQLIRLMNSDPNLREFIVSHPLADTPTSGIPGNVTASMALALYVPSTVDYTFIPANQDSTAQPFFDTLKKLPGIKSVTASGSLSGQAFGDDVTLLAGSPASGQTGLNLIVQRDLLAIDGVNGKGHGKTTVKSLMQTPKRGRATTGNDGTVSQDTGFSYRSGKYSVNKTGVRRARQRLSPLLEVQNANYRASSFL